MVFSHGIYFVYWLFVTWKHYREYTHTPVFPVWHALTQFVPVYSLFRIHTHWRTFRGLANKAGQPTSLAPMLPVAVGLAQYAVGIGSSIGPLLDFFRNPHIEMEIPRAATIARLALLAASTGLVLHAQININRLWKGVGGASVTDAPIGAGEVLISVLGALNWINTIGSFF
jgi:hypothetical protein